jgi:hypothetical protein
MNRRKVVKAVCLPVAVALGTSLATDAADNPHTEPRQHEEEPRMTYESPYSTTSMVVMKFPWFDPYLEGTEFSVVRSQKKK